MADPLSTASAIVGLVALVDQVFRRTFRYVRDVKSADRSIRDLANLLQAMCGTLHVLRERLHVIDTTPITDDACTRPQILEECWELLKDIDEKLSKYERSDRVNGAQSVQQALRKLRWPFDASSTKELLDQLARFNDVLTTALTADTMLAVQDVFQAAGQLREDIHRLERSLSMKMNRLMMFELNGEQREALGYFKRNSDPWVRHNIAAKLRQTGTGKWFLDSDDYAAWLEELNCHLWLSGIPGAGKTVLASAIIDKARRMVASSGGTSALAYFYCDYKDTQTLEASNILSSLVAQLSGYNEESMAILLEQYQTFHKPGRQTTLEEAPSLVDLLQHMSTTFEEVYLIVDGLDECGHNTLEVLTELNKLGVVEESNISTLFLSRHELDIEHALLPRYRHVSIAARNTDLKMFVYAQMDRRTLEGRLIIDVKIVKDKIIDKLVHNADGMFRWVACQNDYLCELTTDNERERALDDLPPDLYSTYERILDRVNKRPASVRRLVQRTVKWLILAESPLSIAALREALAIELGQARAVNGSKPSEQSILRHCSSLIRKSADEEHIEPAHFTVKEFLRSIPASNEAHRAYRIDDVADRLFLGRVCLTYLNFDNFGLIESLGNSSERLHVMSLREHAVLFWSHYAQGQFDDASWLGLACTQLSAGKSVNFLAWLLDYVHVHLGHDDGEDMYTLKERLAKGVGPLHCAAFLQIPPLIAWLIEQGQDVNAVSAFGTPLHCAIRGLGTVQSPDVDEASSGFPITEQTADAIGCLVQHSADASLSCQLVWWGRSVSTLELLFMTPEIDPRPLCMCIRSLTMAGARLDSAAANMADFDNRYGPATAILKCFDVSHVQESYRATFIDLLAVNGGKAAPKMYDNLDLMIQTGSRGPQRQKLHAQLRYAARHDQVSILEKILAAEGVNVDDASEADGLSALHLAARG